MKNSNAQITSEILRTKGNNHKNIIHNKHFKRLRIVIRLIYLNSKIQCFSDVMELVKIMKDQLQMIKEQNRSLKGRVEEEVRARKRLEDILRNNVLQNRSDIEWNDD